MTSSDEDASLFEATSTCREAFVALVVAHFDDTLLPELLEVLGTGDDATDREASNGSEVSPAKQAAFQRRRQEAQLAFVAFLDAFAGRTVIVPPTQVLTRAVRDSAIFFDVAIKKRSPAEVAARRGMTVKRVIEVAEQVGDIVEAVSGKRRRGPRMRPS